MVAMSDGMLNIGAFARASLLSVKSLRAYHAAGILVPARVDPSSGYRVYAASQLVDAAVLKRLRQLDLPLDDVARILQARDPDVTQAVLARHERTMRERLASVATIVAELQAHAGQPSTLTPVFTRVEPARHALAVSGRVTANEFDPFLAEAFRELDDAARAARAAVSGPGGALYPADLDVDGTDLVAVLPVEAAVRPPGAGRVELTELPLVGVAVLTHAGGYDTIDDTYRALGAWVADHADPLDLPVREWYLAGPGDVADPSAFRTEIAWPVRLPADGPEPKEQP